MAFLQWNRLAAMNRHYVHYSLRDFFSTQQKLGIRDICLWAGAPHLLLDDESRPDAAALLALAEEYGLSIRVLAPECTLYQYFINSWNETAREKAFGYFTQAILLAQELGVRVVLVNCGGGAKDMPQAQAQQHAVQMLRRLGDVAAQHGVTLALKAAAQGESNIATTLEGVRELLQQVAHPNVKAALDVCNANASYETAGAWFEALGSDIVLVQLTDGRPGGHLVWGDGIIPLDDVLGVLQCNGYNGPLALEVNDWGYYDDPMAADARNVAALRGHFA